MQVREWHLPEVERPARVQVGMNHRCEPPCVDYKQTFRWRTTMVLADLRRLERGDRQKVGGQDLRYFGGEMVHSIPFISDQMQLPDFHEVPLRNSFLSHFQDGKMLRKALEWGTW
jgi:hypothetical protein